MTRHLCLALVLATSTWGCADDTSGDAARGDGGVDAGPEVPGTDCSVNADCDNDRLCDGEELCVDGRCALGAPIACDDGIECTQDRCSEVLAMCEYLAPDADGDGHPDLACLDADGEPFGDDCDDQDPLRFPGNIESCDDGHDEDCDPQTLGDEDSDDDGFVDALCCNGDACGDDCDDLKPSVNPNASEACDRFDNDCDGKVDEGVTVAVHPDQDRDGHGAAGAPMQQCAGTVGYAVDDIDCDDTDPEVFEGQFEICDNKDNNCNGQADEVEEDAPWYLDTDQDGFGDASDPPQWSCVRLPGRVLSANDCNDSDPAVHPASAEICDAVDNDCNGLRDFNLGVNDFEDDDGDGLADAACGAGGSDCDDRDATTGAGLDEICDRRDNDCDDKVDEMTAQTVWYTDADGDGWGIDRGTALARCEPIPGRSSNLGDCADARNDVHPDANERCDGVDQDCDGRADEGTDFLCGASQAVSACKHGACTIVACYVGFGDCDGDPANGCECAVPAVPNGTGSCTDDADCNDGLYCNGRERCLAGQCYDGTAADCTPGPGVLEGSAEIRNSLDAQRLAAIEVITGDLTIRANGLKALVGLPALRVVGGNLTIEFNPELESLAGLSALTTVGGLVHVHDNPKLTQLPLPALTRVGALLIEYTRFVDLSGLAALVTVDEQLVIRDNPVLTTLSGLGSLRNAGSVTISDNPVLGILSGLTALESVRGDLEFVRNTLSSIALPGLRTVGGDLRLNGEDPAGGPDPYTGSIAFPALTLVGGSLELRERTALTSLDLSALETVRAILSIALDDALPSLALSALTVVGGMEVVTNAGLTSLSLPKLERAQTQLGTAVIPYGIAEGELHVHGNALSTLSMPELTTVEGNLDLFSDYYYNDSTLTSISAPKLNSVGGYFELGYAHELVSLDMNALTTVGDRFDLFDCDKLSNLAMGALATFGSSLYLYSNDALTTLDGFALRNGQGVPTLSVLGAYIEITQHALLCQSEVDQFVGSVVNSGFAGSVYTSGNAVCL